MDLNLSYFLCLNFGALSMSWDTWNYAKSSFVGGLQTHYYVTPVQDFEGYAEVMLGLACYIYLGKVKKFGDIIGQFKSSFWAG